jgi:hypothetical protein
MTFLWKRAKILSNMFSKGSKYDFFLFSDFANLSGIYESAVCSLKRFGTFHKRQISLMVVSTADMLLQGTATS